MAKKKLRKMLGDVNAPSTVALMRLIDTQSKETICNWCINYAEEKILPIFEKHCPNDFRPRNALKAARDYLDGKVISCGQEHHSERMLSPRIDANPVAQAAARL